MKKILSVKYSVDRKEEFQIKTFIYEDENGKFTSKEPYTAKAKQHIKNIYRNYELLSNMCMNVVTAKLEGESILFEYIEGQNFAQLLLNDIHNKDLTALKKNLIKYKRLLSDEELIPFEITEDFREVFGEPINSLNAQSHVVSNIDLNFDNVLVNDSNKFFIIDYEWVFTFPIPLEYVIYRAVTQFFNRYKSKINNFISVEEVYKVLGFTMNDISIYENMESSFRNKVSAGWVKQRGQYFKPNYSKIEVIDQFFEKLKGKEAYLQYFWSNLGDFNEKDSKFIVLEGNQKTYQLSLPEENSNTLRIDPGEKPLVYFQIKQIDEKPILADMLKECIGVYFINKVNNCLEFVTLSTDPQIIFHNFNTKLFNFELTINKDLNFIVQKLVDNGLFFEEQLNIKSQLECQNNVLINELQRKLHFNENKLKEKESLIYKNESMIEQYIKEIEDLKAENLNLSKVNEEILTSKRWKLLSMFHKK